MEEQRLIGTILIVLFIALAFVALEKRIELTRLEDQVVQLQQDLAHERSFGQEMLDSYESCQGTNAKLRDSLLIANVNLSMQARTLGLCFERVPALADIPMNLSVPQNRVELSDVHLTPDSAIINVANLVPGVVGPSQSMAPLLAQDNVVLEIKPSSEEEIQLGDIIIYELRGTRIIHRVVAIGSDGSGWFARTRGDNNMANDPENVRFDQVRGIVVGIVY